VSTWDDLRRIVADLPEVVERDRGDMIQWRVRDKLFVWERPLGRKDVEALGADAPDGPILAARVPDLGVKEALLAADPSVYFTTPHFDGYASVLVRLPEIPVPELEELVIEAWLVQAPKRLAKEFLAGRP
jgi:hypothetical protein